MRVLIVGDSQAEGAPGAALEAKLRAMGHEPYRHGYVGHGAYDWLRLHWPEYMALLAATRPDQVVLIFGSNDPANANLRAALERFKASAPIVWYAGPPRYDRDPEAQARGHLIRQMVSSVFGPRFLDAWPYTGPSVPRAADGLHFTAAGGQAWADGVVRDWSARLRSGGTAWVGPVVFGSLALVGLGLFLFSRFHR